MPKGWVSKTFSFKKSDAEDMKRLEYAADLPNCTADLKALLDLMMAGDHKSFDELMKAVAGEGRKLNYRMPEIASHEFTGNDVEMFEESLVEVDAGQFL